MDVDGASAATAVVPRKGTPAALPTSWAQLMQRQLRGSLTALQATDRLLRGEFGALHSLYAMTSLPTVDPVARTLSSDAGLGALAWGRPGFWA